jgi:hypothetical protein
VQGFADVMGLASHADPFMSRHDDSFSAKQRFTTRLRPSFPKHSRMRADMASVA